MKVLSLQEPWASLIKEKVKCIETRSWKTNYRGEIYIHASQKKVSKNYSNIDRLLGLLSNEDFKYGYIIAKCNLKDCIYMSEEFINETRKSENEFICGVYSVGRYAWILDDIQVLDEPILAKGKLGIWNYDINL
ncbi:MAG: ASCH domain-containing protein [Clostridia bacterium]|nr:ASCH domain-containing protein [Clostridia bacterium]